MKWIIISLMFMLAGVGQIYVLSTIIPFPFRWLVLGLGLFIGYYGGVIMEIKS